VLAAGWFRRGGAPDEPLFTQPIVRANVPVPSRGAAQSERALAPGHPATQVGRAADMMRLRLGWLVATLVGSAVGVAVGVVVANSVL
jgi:hypothetical protein